MVRAVDSWLPLSNEDTLENSADTSTRYRTVMTNTRRYVLDNSETGAESADIDCDENAEYTN